MQEEYEEEPPKKTKKEKFDQVIREAKEFNAQSAMPSVPVRIARWERRQFVARAASYP